MANHRRARHTSNISISCSCILILLIHCLEASADEIVIDNHQLLHTGFVAAPLVTIRPVTSTAGNTALAKTRITKDLIIRSATAFPEVQERLKQLGVSDPTAMSMASFVDVIRTSDYPGRYLYDSTELRNSNLRHPVTKSNYAEPHFASWDAKTLTNMVVTGVVDTSTTMTSTISGDDVQWYLIDDQYAGKLGNIYAQLLPVKRDSTPIYVSEIFASAKDVITQYDALQRSMLEHIGEITFGMPIVYTAEEKGLDIPASIRSAYDVYWVDLVVTYYDVDPADLAEMVFNVAVPEDGVALKLIPLRFGVEVARDEKSSTPELGIEYGGAKVNVGEYFAQTVSYRYLRPTIEAYGEGQRNVSWRITDEAMSGGSHRFAAVLAVRKGTREGDFGFSGHVRLRKSFIGEWYDGELIAGTDSWVLPVSF